MNAAIGIWQKVIPAKFLWNQKHITIEQTSNLKKGNDNG
jgi:hypothetical protein